jgi:molecular chaperone GrpE
MHLVEDRTQYGRHRDLGLTLALCKWPAHAGLTAQRWLWSRAMSGEPNQNGEPMDAPAQADREPDGDVIPVEVEPPPEPDVEARLASLEKDKKDNWDRYLRAAADLENLRKRQRREIDDAKLESKGRVLKEMLPVVDNLERAIEHATNQAGTNPIVEGVQLVLRQFLTAFERLDVTPIDAAGQPFDPNLHEAISQQESEAPPGTVVQVLQRGYKSGDRLLRPALVVVAKSKPAPVPDSQP